MNSSPVMFSFSSRCREMRSRASLYYLPQTPHIRCIILARTHPPDGPPSTEGPSVRGANPSSDAGGVLPTSGSDTGPTPTVERKQLRQVGSVGGTLRQASGSVEGDNISGGRVRWRDIKSGGVVRFTGARSLLNNPVSN